MGRALRRSAGAHRGDPHRTVRAGRGLSRRALLRGAAALAAGAALRPFAACARAPRHERPHVLLVTLDTTRRDRLGCYGYAPPTSPALDALAAEAVVYERAYAPSSWTLPSHASLFTGKFPSSHGARRDVDGPLHIGQVLGDRAELVRIRAHGLAPRERTLAGLFAEAGYRTAGFVGGPWMKAVFGLGAGFDHWDDTGIGSESGRPGASISDAALRWLAADPSRPFFAFLNYFDAHTPYAPAPAAVQEVHPGTDPDPAHALSFENLQRLYDAEIRMADDALGRVLDRLRRDGLSDRTLVVVTSDHGERFGEHGGHGHGRSLWQEEVSIPFVVKWPRGEERPARRDTLVQLTDVLPLLAERARLAVPGSVQGAWPPRSDAAGYAEITPLPHETTTGRWRMWIEGKHKLVTIRSRGRLLYDLAADPGETRDLAGSDAARASAMHARLDAFANALPAAPAAEPAAGHEVDAETRRALENLGYLR